MAWTGKARLGKDSGLTSEFTDTIFLRQEQKAPVDTKQAV
jgi:hypothetical protein